VSEQPPDQPRQQEPSQPPHWQQPDQPSQPEAFPPPQWQQPDQAQPQQAFPPPQWQPPGPGQAPPWPYPPLAGPPPAKRHDARNIVLVAIGGFLLLAALGAGAAVLILRDNSSTPARAVQPTPVTTSAAPAPETSVPTGDGASSSPAGDAEVIKIGSTEYSQYDNGLELRVTSARRITFTELSTTPGPGVIITVKIYNGSKERVALDEVDVVMRYGRDGVEADFVIDDRVREFAGGLAPGRTATATYGFSMPRNQRDISVDVTPGFDYDSTTFEGRLG
jgi:hypothetical protein